MVNPVPGHSVTTGFKKTGSNWTTCGWHTGQDYAAPSGADIVAARGGTVHYVDYGNLGNHQFVIRPGDGTEDFYAHTKTRPASGIHVNTGQYVAEVGDEGNATGPHLHFERHSGYGWSCSLMQDPMLSHNAGGGSSPTPPPASGGYPAPTSKTIYLSKLRYGQTDSDSVWYLQNVLNGHTLSGGQTLPLTGNYLDETDEEVRLCQDQHFSWAPDPVNGSNVGPDQAAHLFNGLGLTVVNDV